MNWNWLNWSWLAVILPAAAVGFCIGVLLKKRWEHDGQNVHRVGRTCIGVAVAAWSAAFFYVDPLATNAIAFGALAVRQGISRSSTDSLRRAMNT
jgi:hypothetical protein